MPPLSFVHDFKHLPAHLKPPHARIVNAYRFNPAITYNELPAIDAVMTVLYHHSVKDLEAFLDPLVKNFRFSGIKNSSYDLVITREGIKVIIGYYKDSEWKDSRANYEGNSSLTKWKFFGGNYREVGGKAPLSVIAMTELSKSVYYSRIWKTGKI